MLQMKKNKAQSIIEYSILLGLLAAGFFTLQVYLKRGIQAGIRASADQLGNQQEGTVYFDLRDGFVENSSSTTETVVPSTTEKTVSRGGVHTLNTQEVKSTEASSESQRKDDGWYYVPSSTGWELRRQE